MLCFMSIQEKSESDMRKKKKEKRLLDKEYSVN